MADAEIMSLVDSTLSSTFFTFFSNVFFVVSFQIKRLQPNSE